MGALGVCEAVRGALEVCLGLLEGLVGGVQLRVRVALGVHRLMELLAAAGGLERLLGLLLLGLGVLHGLIRLLGGLGLLLMVRLGGLFLGRRLRVGLGGVRGRLQLVVGAGFRGVHCALGVGCGVAQRIGLLLGLGHLRLRRVHGALGGVLGLDGLVERGLRLLLDGLLGVLLRGLGLGRLAVLGRERGDRGGGGGAGRDHRRERHAREAVLLGFVLLGHSLRS